MMKEKTLELKKAIQLSKQNTYRKKNKKITIPEALITIKEKQLIKEEPIQRMEKFGARPKQNLPEPDHAHFAKTRFETQYPNVRHRNPIVTTAEKSDTTQGHTGKNKTTTEQ